MTPRRRWYHIFKPKPRLVDVEVSQCFAFRVGETVIASSSAVEALGGDQKLLTDEVFNKIPIKPEMPSEFDLLRTYLKQQFKRLSEKEEELAQKSAELAEQNAKVISLEAERDKRESDEASGKNESENARKERLLKKLEANKRRQNKLP